MTHIKTITFKTFKETKTFFVVVSDFAISGHGFCPATLSNKADLKLNGDLLFLPPECPD